MELCAHFESATPVDDRERESIAEFLQVVPTLANPFDEHTDVRHVTASAIVVGRRGVALHVHKRLGIWLQPGGHIDTGEEPAAAALRESVEELGLAVAHPHDGPQLIHVDAHPGPRGHHHFDVRYLLQVTMIRIRVMVKASRRDGFRLKRHLLSPMLVCEAVL
jgi:ADP-ribose pyrophosphatase YjhB (NUDIX family)